MKIVMVDSTSYRQATRLGSHAIAREWKHIGGDLFWIGAPIYPHFLFARRRRDPVIARRVDVWKRGGARDADGTLEYYPLLLLPPLDRPVLRSAFVARHTLRFSVPPLDAIIRRLGYQTPDVLWLSCGRFARPAQSMMKPRVSAIRIADDYTQFTGVPASLEPLQDEMVDRVDAVFVTSRILEEKVGRRRKDVIYLPNAVSDTFFAPPAPEPEWMRPFPHPRIVFVGSLDNWLDIDVFGEIAKRLPNASVLVIGPGRAPRSAPANVHYLGPRPYETLPAVLQHCDVGIAPFRRNALTESVNPLKVYEYLATGLPVVATRTHELERIDAPIRLCATPAEFANAVAEHTDRDPAGRDARVAFAREHTWSRRFEIVRRALRV